MKGLQGHLRVKGHQGHLRVTRSWYGGTRTDLSRAHTPVAHHARVQSVREVFLPCQQLCPPSHQGLSLSLILPHLSRTFCITVPKEIIITSYPLPCTKVQGHTCMTASQTCPNYSRPHGPQGWPTWPYLRSVFESNNLVLSLPAAAANINPPSPIPNSHEGKTSPICDQILSYIGEEVLHLWVCLHWMVYQTSTPPPPPVPSPYPTTSHWPLGSVSPQLHHIIRTTHNRLPPCHVSGQVLPPFMCYAIFLWGL